MTNATRRNFLCGSMLALAASPDLARADDTDPARSAPPAPGDLLIVAGGDNETPIRPSDLKPGDDPTFAWSLDPKTKLPRDGSRLNQVLLMRFDPSSLGKTEDGWAAQGVVAFSAICTHQGCTVTDWMTKPQVLQCPCHQSQYDPRHGAKVVGGPAPRPLPALPLKIENNVLVVAAKFTDRVGGEPQRTQ